MFVTFSKSLLGFFAIGSIGFSKFLDEKNSFDWTKFFAMILA